MPVVDDDEDVNALPTPLMLAGNSIQQSLAVLVQVTPLL